MSISALETFEKKHKGIGKTLADFFYNVALDIVQIMIEYAWEYRLLRSISIPIIFPSDCTKIECQTNGNIVVCCGYRLFVLDEYGKLLHRRNVGDELDERKHINHIAIGPQDDGIYAAIDYGDGEQIHWFSSDLKKRKPCDPIAKEFEEEVVDALSAYQDYCIIELDDRIQILHENRKRVHTGDYDYLFNLDFVLAFNISKQDGWLVFLVYEKATYQVFFYTIATGQFVKQIQLFDISGSNHQMRIGSQNQIYVLETHDNVNNKKKIYTFHPDGTYKTCLDLEKYQQYIQNFCLNSQDQLFVLFNDHIEMFDF